MSLETQQPTRIGLYTVLRPLGHGGSGSVYLVQQDVPIRRTAALKVLRLGMHSPEMFARFDLERRALAMMDHLNIAKVLDGGTTDFTGPYIVMEYVDGVPITKYCDERKLPLSARLELFVTVCRAIQHAHHRGILHRDVKPSNVLVVDRDGKPQPVVIDFGLARSTEPASESQSALTRHGQPIGTPQYMSPEQLELPSDAIDARTDVYSLGVLLYELMVGVLPNVRTYSPLQPLKLVESVRREETPRPSSRFSQLDAEATAIARARQASREQLVKQVSGDLDWIAVKALENDRERRYSTASELLQDVERCLRREPVLARPPTRAYRFERFVARNRIAFGVSLALLLAMVVGSAASTIWYANAARTWQERGELVGTFQALRRDIADAHLWFEEALAHDSTLDVDRDVRQPIQAAQRTLAIERERKERVLSPAVLDELRGLDAKLAAWDAFTVERWAKRDDAGKTGGTLDQRYDAAYEEIQASMSKLIEEIEKGALESWRRAAQLSIAVNVLAVVIIAGSLALGLRPGFRRY